MKNGLSKLTALILLSLFLSNSVWAFTGAPKDDANCQGAWLMEFDEDPIRDDSQNTNTGAWINDPAFVTTSPPAAYSTGYYGLDANDGFDCGSDSSLDATTLSIVAWVQTEEVESFDTIVSKQNGGNTDRNYWFGVGGNDALSFGFSSSGASKFDDGGGTQFDDGAWHHIAVTFSQPNIIYYLAGVSDDTASLNFTPDTNTGTQTFLIGQADGETLPWLGFQDETSIFDDAINSTEVNDIMDNGLEGAVVAALPQVIINMI